MSAIRLVDIFYYKLKDDIAPEQQAVMITLLATGRFKPEDLSQHLLQLRLVRTTGEIVDLGEPVPIVLSDVQTRIPGVPRGFNIVAQVPVVPKCNEVLGLRSIDDIPSPE